MVFGEEISLPKTSRFQYSLLPENSGVDPNRPLWYTPNGNLDKIKSFLINTTSGGSNYQPYNSGYKQTESLCSLDSLNSANRLEIDASAPVLDQNEIPVFEYGKDFVSDPILFVESIKEIGKKYGAVKVRMPADVSRNFHAKIDPDALVFNTNRNLNNPSENELQSRLRFYTELIEFHTGTRGAPTENGDNVVKREDQTENVQSLSVNPNPEVKPEASVPITQSQGQSVVDIKEEINSNPAPQPSDAKISSPAPPSKSQLAEPESLLKQAPKSKVPMFLAKVPSMDKIPLDLFELFQFVIARGGYNQVIERKLWNEIGKELGYDGKNSANLSSWLKMSYARILYPFEIHLGDRKFEVSHLPNEKNVQEANKRQKLSSGAPLILGSARELQRTVRVKASKGFLLNSPHLIEVKAPLVLSIKDTTSPGEASNTQEENQKETKTTLKKTEELITPITPPAQANNYIKWLANALAVLQDSSRYDFSLKHSSSQTLKQFIDKNAKFQEYLISENPQAFEKLNEETDIRALISASHMANGQGKLKISVAELERLYWEFTIHKKESILLDGLKLQSGTCKPDSPVYTGFYSLSDDYFSYARQIMEPGQDRHLLNQTPATSEDNGHTGTNSTHDHHTISNSVDSETSHHVPGSIDGPSSHLSVRTEVESKDFSQALNSFNIHNIPILPNSLLGAYSSSDINNRALANSSLNIGMTFSTDNWKCEDHFTQSCNYHSFGAAKRCYFIPELEFDKFESLLEEVIKEQANSDISRVNVNYDEKCWHFDQLAPVTKTDGVSANSIYDYLLKSLESMVNPYPEIRASNKSTVFQNLINRKKLSGGTIKLNQEFFISPQLLREKGINFTTTVQESGEFIFKFPKTYSSAISLGFNLHEETNFVSNLWLDYAESGEEWLAKQGVLPSLLFFKLLVNLAQLYESNDIKFVHFDEDVYSKALSVYSRLLSKELELRSKVRDAVKIKETTIEERNIPDGDHIADDTLENAFPSKIIITQKHTHQQFIMTLSGFMEYLSDVGKEGESGIHNVLTDDEFSLELQLLYSDEKLKSFQRLLSSHSVDFEKWLAEYESVLKSDEEVTMKTYKTMLSEGWKIHSALSGGIVNFRKFSRDSKPESSERAAKIAAFKTEVENLQAFVDESTALIEECQTILSLKHQQRIRNGGGENAPQINTELQSGSLDLLLELVNKIPKVSFYAPEFDQIFEFKNELENFDRACRALIQKPSAPIFELDDMISLGDSFGIQIPSLSFLRRLRDRQKWLATYETIISGGDPFSGKKEIFSLTDLVAFRDEGLQILSSEDVEKIKSIDNFVNAGNAYDSKVTKFLLDNSILNKVELRELDLIIEDMVEQSKKTGAERLFVTLETYSRLLDLKAQSPHIKFIKDYANNNHKLSSINQTMNELENCGFRFDGSLIHNDLAKTYQWLDDARSSLEGVTIVNHSHSQRKNPHQALKNAADTKLVKLAHAIYDKCAIGFAGEEADSFVKSSSWIAYENIDTHAEKTPARYCMCRDYEDGIMIECDRCHEWYHINCVNGKKIVEDDNEKYSCPVCLLLESYTVNDKLPVIEGKIYEDTLNKLIAKGEALKIAPHPELELLKKIADLNQKAKEYFDQQQASNTNYGPLFTMFITQKFYGSPVFSPEQVQKLFEALKTVDLPGLFKIKKAEIAAQLQESQQQEPETPMECETVEQQPTFSVTFSTKRSENPVQVLESVPEPSEARLEVAPEATKDNTNENQACEEPLTSDGAENKSGEADFSEQRQDIRFISDLSQAQAQAQVISTVEVDPPVSKELEPKDTLATSAEAVASHPIPSIEANQVSQETPIGESIVHNEEPQIGAQDNAFMDVPALKPETEPPVTNNNSEVPNLGKSEEAEVALPEVTQFAQPEEKAEIISRPDVEFNHHSEISTIHNDPIASEPPKPQPETVSAPEHQHPPNETQN